MFFRLFLLFTLVSILEISLVIEVGSHLGVVPTILLILFTAILGAYLAQTQSWHLFIQLKTEIEASQLPRDTLIDGFLILIGGLLLLTPGFLTDSFGLLLLFPLTRKVFREKLKKYLRTRFI
jgi:UPF0716 protein FxsA